MSDENTMTLDEIFESTEEEPKVFQIPCCDESDMTPPAEILIGQFDEFGREMSVTVAPRATVTNGVGEPEVTLAFASLEGSPYIEFIPPTMTEEETVELISALQQQLDKARALAKQNKCAGCLEQEVYDREMIANG